MPSTTSASLTSSMAPPVRRTTSSAYGPSAGLPMASDLAMVSGLTGRTTSWPSRNACDDRRAAGRLRAEHLVRRGLDQPELDRARANALSTLVSSEPDAIGHDDLLRQPPAELLGDLVAERLASPRRSTGAG